MAATPPSLDPQYARMLAGLIRENMEVLIDENGHRYAQDYSHSVNNNLDEPTKRAWTKQSLTNIASQLEACKVDPHEYETMRGDIVLQNEELLYPIDAYLEMTYYISRMIADLIWEKYLGDTATLNALLETLEKFVQLRTCESLDAFTEQICLPRALRRTWQLGRRWASRSVNTKNDPGHVDDGRKPVPDGRDASEQDGGRQLSVTNGGHSTQTGARPSVLDQLTERESQMALLVAEGKSNNEVASALGLQLSTVRNALSRIYVKLGIASRAELIVALSNER